MLGREARDVALRDGSAQHALGRLGAVGVEDGVATVEVDDLDARLAAQPAGVAGGDELEATPSSGWCAGPRASRRRGSCRRR